MLEFDDYQERAGGRGVQSMSKRRFLAGPWAAVLVCWVTLAVAGATTASAFTVADANQLDAELVSCDASGFPYIYVTVQVTEDGEPVDYLGDEDFSISEDGVEQLGCFDVTPPDSGGGVRAADVVFLIDTSGSMGSQITAVRENANALADGLQAEGIDYRLGLVQFGQSADTGAPRIIGGGLTADVDTFKGWVAGLVASGGVEPGFWAIRLAIENYSFRPGAQKIFILISDEDSDPPGGNGTPDLAGTVSLIQANEVTVHAAVRCTSGLSEAHYCNETSVRGVSGGLLFGVADPFEPVIDAIVAQTANTYIVKYCTDRPEISGCDGRALLCTVDNGVASDFVECAYVAGGAPSVRRTLDTLVLHRSSLAAGSAPVIAVEVTDLCPPAVEGATLYVRVSGLGDDEYTAIAMAPVGDGVFSAAVPGDLVSAPGLDYYIRATDGEVTGSSPRVDPTTMPHQIAVLGNYAPQITHTPPANWSQGTDVSLDIEVTDSTASLDTLTVYYRQEGELVWRSETVDVTGATQVSQGFVLPGGELTSPAVEYYIRATDDNTVGQVWPIGGSDNPYVLADGWQLHAVCVGMDHGQQLDGAADAQAIYDQLTQFGNWAPTNPAPLILDPAQPGNLDAVEQALADIKQNVQPGDALVFYYGGHGGFPLGEGNETPVWVSDEYWPGGVLASVGDGDGDGDGWLNTTDEYLWVTPAGELAESLSDDDLTGWLDDAKWASVTKLIMLDSCGAGGFWGDYSLADQGDLAKLPRVGLMASCPEWGLAFSDPNTGRGLYSQALATELGASGDITQVAGAVAQWDWSEYVGYELPLRQQASFPPYDHAFFDDAYYEPNFAASDDFQLILPDVSYHELTVTVIAGAGSVSPAGGSYMQGTKVKLTATPAAGYQVKAWHGTDNNAIASEINYVTMEGDQIVTIEFELVAPPQYTLTVVVDGPGGTVTPAGGSYDPCTVVDLTAHPNTGYQVKSWSGTQNHPAAGIDTNTVLMDGDKMVTVVFERLYSLTASVVGGHGSISLAPAGGTYPSGTEVTMTVTPETGYRVKAWQGSDNDPSPGSVSNSVTMNADKTVLVECEGLGAVSVTIGPQAAVLAGGQWRIDGAGPYQSGDIVNDITVGMHGVQFGDVDDWTTPDDIAVQVELSQTATARGTYIPAEQLTGSLQVFLIALSSENDPAGQWRIISGGADSSWRSSGAVVGDLTPGTYTVEFEGVPGWVTPDDIEAPIIAGEASVQTGVYIEVHAQPQEPEQTGSLTVSLVPAEAAALAHWRLNGGSWQASGYLDPNILVGQYTVEFEPIDSNWLTPEPITVGVYEDYLTESIGTYTYLPHTAYVATSGNDISGTGSPDHPFATIQMGIDRVAAGGTVIVLDGTYTGPGNRDLDFGHGLPATLTRTITVQSANGPAACVIDCQGSEADPHRGFYFHRGETAQALVQGFTITGGFASVGGGILCAEGSDPTITDCVITANTSKYSGAGLRCNASSPTVVDCVISNNAAQMTGGGVFCYTDSYPLLSGCTISNNTAVGCGAGVYCYSDSGPALQKCLIIGNVANSCGGGLYATTDGGAIVTQCTITANTANIGGGIRCYGAYVYVDNSIVWGNTANDSGSQLASYVTAPTFAYCDIQGSGGSAAWVAATGTDDGGNLDIDPAFVNAAQPYDCHLTSPSPCIDAGDPALQCTEPMPNGGRVNMGAYGNTDEAATTVDTDGDGLTDPTETRWALNSASIDTDGDGLSDYREAGLDGDATDYDPYDAMTGTGSELHGSRADTDGDGQGDHFEVGYDGDAANYNPYDPATQTGTDLNALSGDTDGDGMSDTYEIQNPPLDPLDPTDATGDLDGDGADNVTECQAGSDPTEPTSVPPTFAYGLQITRVRHGAGPQEVNGRLHFFVDPADGATLTAVDLIRYDGDEINLPAADPAEYDQSDLFGEDEVPLAEMQNYFSAGLYTIQLSNSAGTGDTVVFDHWINDYPPFATPTYPTDGASGVEIDPIVTWTGADVSSLQIWPAGSGSAVLAVSPVAGTRSYAVPAGVLAVDQDYVMELLTTSAQPTHRASVSIVTFDTVEADNVIYVDRNATGAADGTSWDDAYASLVVALDQATSGSLIRVADGTYQPDDGLAFIPEFDAFRNLTFQMIDGITVRGGYPGVGAPDPDARDINTYPTILTGQINTGANVYHVVTGADAVLDGVTITGGNADGAEPDDCGGGVLLRWYEPDAHQLHHHGQQRGLRGRRLLLRQR